MHIVVGPYYKTKEVRSMHINFLFLQDDGNSEINGHYVWIKDMSRLIGKQATKHKGKFTYAITACLTLEQKTD